jgi:hypothetical protein
MSIFSQLWHVVAGDSAEQPNDVRSLFSIVTLSALDRPSKPNKSTTVDFSQADAMLSQTNDGSLHSPNALPPNPFSQSSPATSRPSTTTSIDLTSHTRHSRISEQRDTQTKAERARLLKNKRSPDEMRLIGDYEYERGPRKTYKVKDES